MRTAIIGSGIALPPQPAVSDIDVVVAHQVNEHILDAVRKEMGVDATIIPSSIARYGKTTAATYCAAGKLHCGLEEPRNLAIEAPRPQEVERGTSV